jgi:parallel beta-helix repeat protein
MKAIIHPSCSLAAAAWVLLLAGHSWSTAWAGPTSYFVDANQGNDLYSGKVAEPDARHGDGPVRTIQAAYDRLQPGDTLYVKRGVYRETVTLNKTASQFSPIVIQAFPGDEGLAIISGAAVIQNWRPCPDQASCGGNPNWAKIVTADVGAEIKQLFQAGVRLKVSRYPNRGWLYPTGLVANEPSTAFLDSTLRSGGVCLAGSTCNLRTSPWHLDQIQVTSVSAADGKVSLASPTRYSVSANSGYYFTNLVSEINEPGEWAFDRGLNRVFVWPVAGSLENIEATVRECGVTNSRPISYHTLKGLVVRYAGDGVRLARTSHMLVTESSIEYAFHAGIVDSKGSSSVFSSNLISHSGTLGVAQDELCTGGLIENNFVVATGVESLGEDLLNGDAIGMAVYGSRSRVIGNRIDRSGYNGLYAGRGDTSGREIAYNSITNSCLALSDGAAIYTDGRSSSSDPDCFHHNLISDAWGWQGGWAGAGGTCAPDAPLCGGEAYGIYLDEQGNNRIFEENTITRCATAGVFVHWAQDNRLANNTLYGNGRYQILLSGKSDPRFLLKGNVVTGNALIATAAGQRTLQVNLDYNDIDFGECDGNRFDHPQSLQHMAVCRDQGGTQCTSLSLVQWREVTGRDAHSVDLSRPGSALPVLLTNPSMAPASITLPGQEYVDLEGHTVKDQVVLDPYESLVLLPQAAPSGG